jgi:hypothetical protein
MGSFQSSCQGELSIASKSGMSCIGEEVTQVDEQRRRKRSEENEKLQTIHYDCCENKNQIVFNFIS